MRSLLLALAALCTVSCASRYPQLAVHSVVEVAKAPVRQWKSVAVTTAVVGGTLLLDDEIADLVRNNDSTALDTVTRNVEPFGGGASDKVMAGFLLYGLAGKNERARNVAFDAFLSSVIASKGITPMLKLATHRARPNGGNDDSFPSNHATQAFAVASVIATHYEERRWVRWAAYTIAGGVGFARVYHDAHHTSDILAGAAIGTLVGTTVARANRNARANWTVVPTVGREGVGFMVHLSK
ncbi:MAG: hypothetical protein QOJ98_3618 [Acidobacteriota bacterium]|nr:hypothetical protein [Acidobacteriota bacterium]